MIEAWQSFRGRPQALNLPSAPSEPLVYLEEANRPQPSLDVHRGGGMTVTVGRLRPCPVLGYKFVALGHNTIRGAAGAAILNAELMHRRVCCERRHEIRRHVGRRRRRDRTRRVDRSPASDRPTPMRRRSSWCRRCPA